MPRDLCFKNKEILFRQVPVAVPRASINRTSARGAARIVDLALAQCKQKPPVVVGASPRSQAPVARSSAFRLPISRGKCTRRTAPAPLTHRTRYPRCSLLGSAIGRTSDLVFNGLVRPLKLLLYIFCFIMLNTNVNLRNL